MFIPGDYLTMGGVRQIDCNCEILYKIITLDVYAMIIVQYTKSDEYQNICSSVYIIMNWACIAL